METLYALLVLSFLCGLSKPFYKLSSWVTNASRCHDAHVTDSIHPSSDKDGRAPAVVNLINKSMIWHTALIARFMGPTWDPSGADRIQVGPRLASWTLLSGCFSFIYILLMRLLGHGETVPICFCMKQGSYQLMYNDYTVTFSVDFAIIYFNSLRPGYASGNWVIIRSGIMAYFQCTTHPLPEPRMIFSCDQAALWMVFSVCLSVRPSVCPSHLFDYVPLIVLSWNFQELSPRTRVTSMQKVKVRGQRSRSQRSQPNLAVSGL